MYKCDTVYVTERALTNRFKRLFKRTDYDAVLFSHPSAVGTLYTVLDAFGGVHVITSREAGRRFNVVRAVTEEFKEDVAVVILNDAITDKWKYVEELRRAP